MLLVHTVSRRATPQVGPRDRRGVPGAVLEDREGLLGDSVAMASADMVSEGMDTEATAMREEREFPVEELTDDLLFSFSLLVSYR